MWGKIKELFFALRDAYRAFNADSCRLMAGAIAYYTLFALPIILLVSVYISSLIFGSKAAEGQMGVEIGKLVGEVGAEQVTTIVEEAQEATHENGGFAPFIAFGVLLFGAIRAFEQLQEALNRVWKVDLDPQMSGWMKILRKRSMSFIMMACISAVLAVSLVASMMLTAVALNSGPSIATGLSGIFLRLLDFSLSVTVITVLFALVYKILPDADIAWRDVWVGACFSAFVFVISKFLIGAYLGRSNIASAYGAAGSLAVLLLWIYFSSLIMLYGAEFTKVWASKFGEPVTPSTDAVTVVVTMLEPDADLAGAKSDQPPQSAAS